MPLPVHSSEEGSKTPTTDQLTGLFSMGTYRLRTRIKYPGYHVSLTVTGNVYVIQVLPNWITRALLWFGGMYLKVVSHTIGHLDPGQCGRLQERLLSLSRGRVVGSGKLNGMPVSALPSELSQENRGSTTPIAHASHSGQSLTTTVSGSASAKTREE